jgi:hypothetical protein
LDDEGYVRSLLLSLVLLAGCASDDGLETLRATSNSSASTAQLDSAPDPCGTYPDLSNITDPFELSRLVVNARLTWFDGTDGYCPPCEKCEDAVTKGLYRLAELNTEAAAREAAAIALDPRMEWDGGPSLLMGDAVSRFGPLVVPYLEPHEKTSLTAARILECVRRRVPCL